MWGLGLGTGWIIKAAFEVAKSAWHQHEVCI
jgi:hypothetical protein